MEVEVEEVGGGGGGPGAAGGGLEICWSFLFSSSTAKHGDINTGLFRVLFKTFRRN